jgi:hypothetical protein
MEKFPKEFSIDDFRLPIVDFMKPAPDDFNRHSKIDNRKSLTGFF